MRRVLIGAPVRQEPSILAEYLQSLAGLETEGLETACAFVDDCGGGSPLLAEFAAARRNTRVLPADGPRSPYVRDENRHYWPEDAIWQVASYKDRLIRLARDEDFDCFFLVDSDLVLHPRTLVHLIGLGKDIVAEVFWTAWNPGEEPLPSVWDGGQYRLYHWRRDETLAWPEGARRTREYLGMLRRPGTYLVGGLASCTLFSRRALSLGLSFAEVYNLDLWGEDRHLCLRAAVLGLELYADTRYPPYHIYRASDLAALADYKKRNSLQDDPPSTLFSGWDG